MSSTARATATEQRTCSTCAHYMVSRDSCTEWNTPTRASATCERWFATHGAVEREPDDRVLFRASLKSGVQVDRITRREVTMDVAEETVTQLSNAPAGVDRIAVLKAVLDERLTYRQVRERFGLGSNNTVQHHLRRGELEGLIKKVGHGRYEWVDPVGSSKAKGAAGVGACQECKRLEERMAALDDRLSQLAERQGAALKDMAALGRRLDELSERLGDFAEEDIELIARDIERLSAELRQLARERTGAGDAERTLRIVEKALALVEGRPVA